MLPAAAPLTLSEMPRDGTDGELGTAAAIFDRYNQRLYRYCLAIVANSQDAQDALQNTMVKVLRTLPREKRPIELKPWLYRIAHNESIELLRRRRDTRQLDAELAAPGSGLAEEAASRERLRRLISDLDELPERQRGALVMRELGGLDFAEIGAALGTSSRAARQTLYEARLSLRGMDEGREMSCETVTRALSAGDGRVIRRRDLRAHLHNCRECRRFREEIEVRELDLAALSPLPAAVAARLLERLLSGHGVSGGLAGVLGGGAAHSLGSAAAVKAVATVAVVAALGAGAAYQGGLADTGRMGDRSPQRAQAARPAAAYDQVAVLGRHSALPVAGAEHAAGLTSNGRVGVPSTLSSTRKNPASPASEVASPAEDKVVANFTKDKSDAVDDLAPDPQGDSSAPLYGKGHKEQPPAASHGSQSAVEHRNSEHGQRAAAEHKGSEHGQQTAAEHKAEHGPASESHPAHPSHPAGPGAKPEPSESPAGGVPEAAAEPAFGEEVPAGHETGKGHGHGHE